MVFVSVGNRRPKVRDEVLPEGEYITQVQVDDDSEQLLQVVEALKLHFAEGDVPAWVECENRDLLAGLVRHYRIQNNSRPEGWGESVAN